MSKPKRMIKKTIIERIEIVDRIDARAKIVDELRTKGYRIMHCWPYATAKMYPGVNHNWFMLTAERISKSDGN